MRPRGDLGHPRVHFENRSNIFREPFALRTDAGAFRRWSPWSECTKSVRRRLLETEFSLRVRRSPNRSERRVLFEDRCVHGASTNETQAAIVARDRCIVRGGDRSVSAVSTCRGEQEKPSAACAYAYATGGCKKRPRGYGRAENRGEERGRRRGRRRIAPRRNTLR